MGVKHGPTQREVQAAYYFLWANGHQEEHLRHVAGLNPTGNPFYLITMPHENRYNCCRQLLPFVDTLKIRAHLLSLEHIAHMHNLSTKRVQRALKVAKVMQALES